MKRQPLLPGILLTGAVAVLVAQPAWAQVTQVTGVQLKPTPSGLEVILDTADGATPQVFTSSSDQTLILDVSNAQLRLPSGNEFRAVKPIEGIVEVTVTNLNANSIQVRVTGSAELPIVEVFKSDEEGLILSLTPAPQTAEVPSRPETPQEEAAPAPEPETPEVEPEGEGEPAAEAQEEEAIQVVVTATRTEEELQNLPRAVTVITRQQIEQQAAVTRDVQEILGQLVPGLGPPGQVQTNFGQSLRGRRPFVLVDGVPISSNNATAFARDLRSIAPNAIERIEVVRGPSAIYGDGATGGIINIITRRSTEQRLTSTAEVGVNSSLTNAEDSFGNFIEYLISGTESNVDYTISLSRNDIGAFFDAEGDRIPLAAEGSANTETYNVLGKLGVNLNDEQRLQVTFNHFRDDQDINFISDPIVAEIPGRQKARALARTLNFIDTPEPGNLNTLVNLDYTHENLFGSQLTAQAYYRDTTNRGTFFDDRIFDPDTLLGVARLQQQQERFGGRLQIETPLFQNAGLLWGVDYANEDLGETADIFDLVAFDNSDSRVLQKIGERTYAPLHNVENLGLFAQLQWDVSEQWLLSSGLRYESIGLSIPDYVSSTGNFIQGGDRDFNATVFNVGVVYKPIEPISLFANFAQGFSIPAIARILYDPAQGFAVERDLRLTEPQKVNSYEIGVRGEWSSVQASLSAFYNESDLGAALETAEFGRVELIRAPQRNYGIEANLDVQLSESWQLGSTVSWVEGENDQEEDGEYVALSSFDIQPLKLTAYVENETLPGWRNRFQALFVGNRDRAFEADVDPVGVDSYLVVDYISSVQLGSGTLQIGVQNLFNNQYSTVVNQVVGGFNDLSYFAAPGRTLSVSYRVSW